MLQTEQYESTLDYLLCGGPGSGRYPKGSGQDKESDLMSLLKKFGSMPGAEKTLWARLGKVGEIGTVAPFSKEELATLKSITPKKTDLGLCFMNSQHIATNGYDVKSLRYMEGLASVHAIPIDHAYTEFNGKIYDPTMATYKPGQEPVYKVSKYGDPSKPFPTPEYVGVEVAKVEILKHQSDTGMYAPISHNWRNEKLMKQIWDKEVSAGGPGSGRHAGKWIGCDLDGTLAHKDKGGDNLAAIGKPIPGMIARIKQHLADGKTVKILTARVAGKNAAIARKMVADWTEKHIGQRLAVTNKKDHKMVMLYDDRAVQVRRNTGEVLGKPEEIDLKAQRLAAGGPGSGWTTENGHVGLGPRPAITKKKLKTKTVYDTPIHTQSKLYDALKKFGYKYKFTQGGKDVWKHKSSSTNPALRIAVKNTTYEVNKGAAKKVGYGAIGLENHLTALHGTPSAPKAPDVPFGKTNAIITGKILQQNGFEKVSQLNNTAKAAYTKLDFAGKQGNTIYVDKNTGDWEHFAEGKSQAANSPSSSLSSVNQLTNYISHSASKDPQPKTQEGLKQILNNSGFKENSDKGSSVLVEHIKGNNGFNTFPNGTWDHIDLNTGEVKKEGTGILELSNYMGSNKQFEPQTTSDTSKPLQTSNKLDQDMLDNMHYYLKQNGYTKEPVANNDSKALYHKFGSAIVVKSDGTWISNNSDHPDGAGHGSGSLVVHLNSMTVPSYTHPYDDPDVANFKPPKESIVPENKTPPPQNGANSVNPYSKEAAADKVSELLAKYTDPVLGKAYINYTPSLVDQWGMEFNQGNDKTQAGSIAAASGKGLYPELAAHFGLTPQDVNKGQSMIRSWTGSSSKMLRDVFGKVARNEPDADKSLLLEKEITKQKLSADHPSGTITLHRGINTGVDPNSADAKKVTFLKMIASPTSGIDLGGQWKVGFSNWHADSWSSDPFKADSFKQNGVRITHPVDVDHILTSYATNPVSFSGHPGEKEYVVTPPNSKYILEAGKTTLHASTETNAGLRINVLLGKTKLPGLKVDKVNKVLWFDITQLSPDWLHPKEVNASDEDGEWRTIRGLHVLIKEGETVKEAFERTLIEKQDKHEARLAKGRDIEKAKRQALNKQGLSQRGKPIVSEKAQRALKSMNVASKPQQDLAEDNEVRVTKALGATKSGDNSPFDVTLKIGNKLVGIEVKALITQNNDKITQKGDAINRKYAYAANNKMKSIWTCAVDYRASRTHPTVYVREGVGSFRLGNMTKLPNGFSGLKGVIK